MNMKEFRQFAKEGVIGSICLFLDRESDSWEVWAYDHDGSRAVGAFGNQVKSERAGTPRRYTSLDRAHTAVRLAGYKGLVTIDSGSSKGGI